MVDHIPNQEIPESLQAFKPHSLNRSPPSRDPFNCACTLTQICKEEDLELCASCKGLQICGHHQDDIPMTSKCTLCTQPTELALAEESGALPVQMFLIWLLLHEPVMFILLVLIKLSNFSIYDLQIDNGCSLPTCITDFTSLPNHP